MDLHLNYKDGKPLYEQIFDQVAAQITKGDLAADTCLPSIRFLAKELNVSVITAKNAYELLEAKGYVYMRAGKGCFVSAIDRGSENTTTVSNDKLVKELDYYKRLGVTKEEMSAIVDFVYEND